MRRTASAIACALLLLAPITLLYDKAHGITSNLFVSQSVKNINGKATQQINAGQQAMVSVSILNYDMVEQPLTAIIDVRDEFGTSVHIEWASGVAGPGSQFEAEFPWTAHESGSYTVRTFVITGFESPQVISRASSSKLIVSNSDTLKSTFVPGNLTGISKFAMSSSLGQYTAWFTLLDKNGKQTTFDGKAKLTVTDSLGEIRYSSTFPVAADDFILFKPDDNAANIAYVWKVRMLDLDPGLGQGTAVLTFTSSDGRIYSSTFGPIEIYQVSGNNLAQEYERMYTKNAHDIGRTVVKDSFKVTVTRAGQFVHLSNGTSGDQVTHYRADVTIENFGNSISSWPSQYMIIDNKSNQYNATGGTLHAGSAVPGYSKTGGYLLFDGIGESAAWIKLVVVGDPANSKDVYEFQLIL
jgi:hypothetical protein